VNLDDEQGDDDCEGSVAECFQAASAGKLRFFVLGYLNLTFSGCRIRGLRIGRGEGSLPQRKSPKRSSAGLSAGHAYSLVVEIGGTCGS
jgi:hypothetical protein